MTLHAGCIYQSGNVRLCPPDPEAVRKVPKSPDVADSVDRWLSAALERDNVYYFSICCGDEIVGQILLHDVDWQSGESLVGYHLFRPDHRGIGIGTKALVLLQEFVAEQGRLAKLVIITSKDNIASQRVAQKCGFAYAGAPREDPAGLVFQWESEVG